MTKMNISENLVYAGGCALNSLANKKLSGKIFDENIFIPNHNMTVGDQLVLL